MTCLTDEQLAALDGHTPGEWSVPHFAEPDAGCSCNYVLTGHLLGAVATVHASGAGHYTATGDNPKFAEACANARLIAAAPALLAEVRASRAEIVALREALTVAVNCYGKPGGPWNVLGAPGSWIAMARAALESAAP